MQVHRQLFLQEKDPEKGLACDDPFRLTPPLWAFPERAAFQCQRVPLFESIITDPCRSCRACSLNALHRVVTSEARTLRGRTCFVRLGWCRYIWPERTPLSP